MKSKITENESPEVPEDERLKKNNPSTPIKIWMMWGLVATFYLFQYLLRVSPIAMLTDLARDLNADACAFGFLSSYYYLGYSAMQIIVGFLLDKYGPKKPLVVACLICATGSFLFASTSDIYIMSTGRFLIGVGSAFGFLSCLKVATIWFHPKQLPFLMGLTMVIGVMGAIFAGKPLSQMVDNFGWRQSMYILGLFSIILAIINFLIIQKAPKSSLINKDHKDSSWLNIFSNISKIIKEPKMMIILIYGFVSYIPISGFGDLWGAAFAKDYLNISKQEATLFTTFFFTGIAVGSFIYPKVLEILKSYRNTLMLSSALTGSCYTYLLFGPNLSSTELYIMFFLLGATNSGQLIGFSYIASIFSKKISGLVAGIYNTILMFSGFFAQPVIGYMLDRSPGKICIDNVTMYDKESYQIALSIIIIATSIGTITCLFVKDTYKEHMQKH